MAELKLKEFRMRLVEEEDADFIVSLRTDKDLAKHLHQTSPDVAAQKNWIREYKKRELQEKEFYFVAETYDGEKLGLNRLYNFTDDAFELGSWIFRRGLNENVPILADLAVRDFAFEQLKYKICRFDVRKENKSVVHYHKLFKPQLVREDELNYYFELDYPTYITSKEKILKIINNG